LKDSSIKVGLIMDLTGPLSFLGIANASVAKMVVDDINAKGGLLGRQVELDRPAARRFVGCRP
jgi:ABC-type branched-subunit amino acid transport system substrate-binding protein